MSNEFALPIAVKLAPRRRLIAALIALHCLPLPLLFTLGAWWTVALVVVVVAVSLGFELHRLRRAGDATRLMTTADNEWLIYRGDADAPDGRIQFIDGADCGRFILLLVAQHGRRFPLLINAGAQPAAQRHRLKVWLANRRAGAGN